MEILSRWKHNIFQQSCDMNRYEGDSIDINSAVAMKRLLNELRIDFTNASFTVEELEKQKLSITLEKPHLVSTFTTLVADYDVWTQLILIGLGLEIKDSGEGSWDGWTSKLAWEILLLLVSFQPKTYVPTVFRALAKETASSTNTHKIILQQQQDVNYPMSDRVLQQIVSQLCHHDDIQVSSDAHNALVALGKLCPSFRQRSIGALYEDFRESWKKAHESSRERQRFTTSCVRSSQTIVILTTQDSVDIPYSREALDCLILLLSEFSDPLLQISALDLIQQLSSAPKLSKLCFEWLYAPSILNPIIQVAGGDDTSTPADPILGGPALQLASTLVLSARNYNTEVLSVTMLHNIQDLERSVRQACRLFPMSNEMDRCALVDAISTLAKSSFSTSSEANNNNNSFSIPVWDVPELRDRWLSLSVAQSQLKAATLMSVAQVLQTWITTTISSLSDRNKSHQYAVSLYRALGQCNGYPNTTSLLLSCCPILETRLAVYALWEAMAHYDISVFVLNPEFLALVTRRETTYDGQLSQNKLLQTILRNSNDRLPCSLLTIIQQYQNQGLYHRSAQVADMMAGE
jgi:hypothetical protein